MNTRISLQYLAGLIDGDGCFEVQKQKPVYYYGRLCIYSCNHKVLKIIQDKFGGNISQRKRIKTHHRIEWVWYYIVNGKNNKLIKNLIPYLIIKKDQAKIILELTKLIGKQGKKVSSITVKKREEVYQKLLSCEGRGYYHALYQSKKL